MVDEDSDTATPIDHDIVDGSVEPEETGPRWDWRHPSLDAVVLLLLVAVGVRVGLGPLGDNSFLTHLATGRLILDHGSIPHADPYSFTAHGTPWTVQSWGASVLYAGTERAVGLVGIRIINGAVAAALVLVLWRLTRPAKTLVPRALSCGIVVCMGTGLWVERPLLFGALFLALVLLAADGQLDPRWLVPVMWLWVNIHGSFPFGPAFLVLVVIGRWLDDRTKPAVELRALGWATLGTALGAIGPIGPKLLLFPLELLSKRQNFVGVAEWQPPRWHQGVEQFFAIQLALLVVIALLRDRRWRTLLPTVVFGLAALSSTRNILQASIVFTPLLATAMAGMGSIQGSRRPRMARPFAAALALLIGLITVVSVASPSRDLAPYPEQSVAWLRAHGGLGLDDRVITQDYVGNYLEYRYGPDKVRTFFDDRVDMYPTSLIKQYIVLNAKARTSPAQFTKVLNQVRPTAVIWERDSNLGRFLASSDQWNVIHRDEKFLVAIPRGSE